MVRAPPSDVQSKQPVFSSMQKQVRSGSQLEGTGLQKEKPLASTSGGGT